MIVKSLLQTCSSEWFALPWRMIRVLFGHRLPSLPFIAVRSEIAGHQLMCSLPSLRDQVDDLLSPPLGNRYLESLLANGRPDKGDCQVAADIRLRLCLLRCFEDF